MLFLCEQALINSGFDKQFQGTHFYRCNIESCLSNTKELDDALEMIKTENTILVFETDKYGTETEDFLEMLYDKIASDSTLSIFLVIDEAHDLNYKKGSPIYNIMEKGRGNGISLISIFQGPHETKKAQYSMMNQSELKLIFKLSDRTDAEKVVEAYQSLDENVTPTSILKESKNTIDEFKTIFDVCVNQISFDEWLKFELTRQQDKTINNKIGEFHQELLGKVEGWVDLGIGDETEIDLKKEDNTVFIELKNKYNTMNSSSEKTCREKLEKVIEKYPDATAYWAYVISKNYKSEDRIWKYQQREDERIRRISGDRLYTMVTGDPKALEKTFNAIPKAIVEILGEEYKLTEEDEELQVEYNNIIFKNEED